MRPAEVRFVHVFAREAKSLEVLVAGGACCRGELSAPALAAGSVAGPPPFGDASPISRDVRGTEEELARTYGAELAAEAMRRPLGVWSTPLASRLGHHLILVLEKKDAAPAEFSEVRARVELAFLLARKQDATENFLREAYPRYRIAIDDRPFLPTEIFARASNASRDKED